MALKAGRVGVRDDQVDSYGRITTNSYNLPTATATRLGGIKVGDGLSVTSAGKLSADGYNLPTASADTLGGVKVGNGLSISDGVLSADVQEIPTASANTLGGVKVGSGLSIADGVLSASGGAPIFRLWKVFDHISGGTYDSMLNTRIGNGTSYPIPEGYTPIAAIANDTATGYAPIAILSANVWYGVTHYTILSYNTIANATYDVYVILVKTSAFEPYTP